LSPVSQVHGATILLALHTSVHDFRTRLKRVPDNRDGDGDSRCDKRLIRTRIAIGRTLQPHQPSTYLLCRFRRDLPAPLPAKQLCSRLTYRQRPSPCRSSADTPAPEVRLKILSVAGYPISASSLIMRPLG
jgi:hypothetical protein